MWLFVAFIAVPLIEIALFIQIGGWIGLWPTLAIVVLTAALGTVLVRAQGTSALADLQRSFSRLDNPATPLAHGAMILFAGALLLTPGFFTDALGFALLAPPVRSAILAWARQRITIHQFEMGGDPSRHPGAHGGQRPSSSASDQVIDGEFTEVPSKKTPNHPGSGWTKH